MLTIHQTILNIPTHGKNLHNITSQVQSVVSEFGIDVGMCNLFLRHSSASLIIQENADPDVLLDLESFFTRLIPEEGFSENSNLDLRTKLAYRHSSEGADDMPAHIRTALTSTSEAIPIAQGKLLLGTWQGIYVWEHRSLGRTREVVVNICGRQ
jgi:secondary thiamine-phosphate synthase enzyme